MRFVSRITKWIIPPELDRGTQLPKSFGASLESSSSAQATRMFFIHDRNSSRIANESHRRVYPPIIVVGERRASEMRVRARQMDALAPSGPSRQGHGSSSRRLLTSPSQVTSVTIALSRTCERSHVRILKRGSPPSTRRVNACLATFPCDAASRSAIISVVVLSPCECVEASDV